MRSESTATRHTGISLEMSSTRHILSPQARYHVPGVFLNSEPTLTHKVTTPRTSRSKPAATLALKQQAITLARSKYTKKHWFHSLPFQQFQALLTLFSKSFSPFPHGTCLLSVSNQYLALDEIYHPICAPIPRNVTLRTHAVHGGLQMTNGTLTLIGALFQEAYTCAAVGCTSRDYNSRPGAQILMLSSSLFIRHY